MELTGKISALSIDYLTGTPKLTIEVDKNRAFIDELNDMKDCEKLSIKIEKYRKKRSLNANRYAWSLIGKIAENQRITKEEVYKQYIKDVGVYRQVEIDEKSVDTLIYSWSLHGLGWISEKLDYGMREGFVLLNLYYGSSTYNTLAMSRLIDNIIQDCKILGIETKPPNEIADLLSLWESENKGGK